MPTLGEVKKNYQENSPKFIHTMWGTDVLLWDKLLEVANALQTHQRVVVPSGHGVGKTFLAARLILWFFYAYGPAKVITSAPTWYQVEKLLWSELRVAFNTAKVPLGGRLLQTQLTVDDNWFAIGLSPKEDAGDNQFGVQRLQGFHAENLLVVLDEASAIALGVQTAAKSLIVGSNNKILMIGNPTSPSGPFFDACRSPEWKKVTISCFDHPNVKTGTVVVPGAVTREWIETQRKEWGEDSPLWKAKVLGQFPAEGSDTLIPLTWAEMATTNELPRVAKGHLSVDVARFGSDKTVLADMNGRSCLSLEEWQGQDTVKTTGQVMRKWNSGGYTHVVIDDDGVGGGVTDQCDDLDVETMPFHGGGTPREPDKFEMIRDEAYWILREAFQPSVHGKQQIAIPNDLELINQLTSIKYSFTRKGKIKVESKDEMKRRGLKSPDKADALAMGYYYRNAEDVVQGDDGGVMIV